MEEDVYLLLPVFGRAGAKEEQFIKVDRTRYKQKSATTFYRRMPQTHGAPDKYFPLSKKACVSESIPAQPIESAPRSESILIGSLEAFIDGQMREVTGFLISEQPEQKKLSGDVNDFAETIKSLLHAFANQNQSQCEDAIQNIAQQLGVVMVEMIAELKRSASETQTLEELAKTETVVSKKSDNKTIANLYNDWGLAAICLRDACHLFTENANRVKALSDKASVAFTEIQVQLMQKDGLIHQTLEYLDSPDSPEGSFISRLLACLTMSEADDACLRDVEEAERRIRECEAWLVQANETHRHFCVERKIVCGETSDEKTPRMEAERACAEIAKYQESLRYFLNSYTEDQGPSKFDPTLISAEVYAEACSYVTPTDGSPHDWYPGQISSTLRQNVQRLTVLLSMEPQFPKELSEAIKTAKEQIVSVRRQISPKSSKPPLRNTERVPSSSSSAPPDTSRQTLPSPSHSVLPSEPRRKIIKPTSCPPSSARPVSRSSRMSPSSTNSVPPIIRHRTVAVSEAPAFASVSASENPVDRLYELLICVGYVCTYLNQNHLAQKSVQGMMRVLVKLGKCTQREVELYTPALAERVTENGEYIADAMQMRTSAKDSERSWVHASYRKKWVRRLTTVGATCAPALLVKHGLEKEDIVQANLQVREAFAITISDRSGEKK